MLMGMVVTKAEECPITLTTCKEIPAACLTTLCPEIPYWRLKPPTTGILPKKVCVSVIQPSGAIEPSGGIRCNAALALTVLPITDVCPSQIYAYVEYTNGEKYAFRGAGHALLPTPSGGGFVPPAATSCAQPGGEAAPQGALLGFCAPASAANSVPAINAPAGSQWSITIGSFACYLRFGTRSGGPPASNYPTGSGALRSISCSPTSCASDGNAYPNEYCP